MDDEHWGFSGALWRRAKIYATCTEARKCGTRSNTICMFTLCRFSLFLQTVSSADGAFMAVAMHLIAPIVYGMAAKSYTPLTLCISDGKLGDFNECTHMVIRNQTGGETCPMRSLK